MFFMKYSLNLRYHSTISLRKELKWYSKDFQTYNNNIYKWINEILKGIKNPWNYTAEIRDSLNKLTAMFL